MSVIGVDIGGTFIKAGVVDKAGNILSSIKVPTNSKQGKVEVIKTIIFAIERLMPNYGMSKYGKSKSRISHIGIGVPGSVDTKKGVIIHSPNTPLSNVPLAKILQKKFRKKVILENDANCFGIAEAKAGAGRRYNTVLCLTLGTGIGSALVVDGKLYKGKGGAPELGHTTININGPKCSCGSFGCVEEYVSSRGLLRIARHHGINANDPKDVFLAAKSSNKSAINAIKTFEEYGRLLGTALANFVDAFDPDIIVLGGQISKSWTYFNKSMTAEMKRRSFLSPCKVVPTKIEEAGVVGAGFIDS